jgi:hypothetical protein
VRFRPLLGATITAAALACLSSAPVTASVRHSPSDGGTDVVHYQCESATDRQIIRVRVELTMPVDPRPGEQLVIGWRGTYVDGTQLTAPASGLTDAELYAYASISDMPGFTSATGVAPLANTDIRANEPIPLPEGTVELRSTPNSAGTATVRPAAINFGPRPTEPVIRCEVLNADSLRTYRLTIGGGTGDATSPSTTPTASSPTPTPSATGESGTPTPGGSATETGTTDDSTGTSNGDTTGTSNRVVRTPVGSVATGGGGEAGPDARLIVLGGLLLTAAGTGGLLWRRLRPRRT